MSSGGGSSSDSGSTGSYDEAGISTPTSSYESIGNTDSGGGNTGYSDFSSPSSTTASQDFSTQAVSGGQTDYNSGSDNDYRGDGPGYNPYASPTSKTASKDFYGAGDGRYDKDVMESGGSLYTNLGDNVQRRFDKQAELEGFAKAANVAGWVLNPIGKATSLGTTALADTLKANYLLGNINNPFSTWTSPAGDWFSKNTTQASAYTQNSGGGDSGGGDSGQQQAAAPTQTISGVQIGSPAQKFYNQQQQTGQLSFQSDYDKARQQVNGLLGSPSSVGLLAVNESPFYGFLKSNNLNRRII